MPVALATLNDAAADRTVFGAVPDVRLYDASDGRESEHRPAGNVRGGQLALQRITGPELIPPGEQRL